MFASIAYSFYYQKEAETYETQVKETEKEVVAVQSAANDKDVSADYQNVA
jgi:hypothetical protein